MHLKPLAALAIALTASAGAFADPTIVNGSFESQVLADGTRYTGTIDGWIKTFHGPLALISGNIVDNNGNAYGVTPFGNNYVGLDPISSGFRAGVSQVISGFVAGQDYALSLYVADSDGGRAPLLNVLLSNGSDVTYLSQNYNVPVGGPYGTVIDFTHLVINFTAPVTGDITLGLFNAGSSFVTQDPGSISIDNVSIAAVPEASTLASMVAGLGMIGTLMARRRKAATTA